MNESLSILTNHFYELVDRNPDIRYSTYSGTIFLSRHNEQGDRVSYMTLTLIEDKDTNEIYPRVSQTIKIEEIRDGKKVKHDNYIYWDLRSIHDIVKTTHKDLDYITDFDLDLLVDGLLLLKINSLIDSLEKKECLTNPLIVQCIDTTLLELRNRHYYYNNTHRETMQYIN